MDEACKPHVSDLAADALHTIMNAIIRPCHTPEQKAWFELSIKGQINALMHEYNFEGPEDLTNFHRSHFSSIYTYSFGGRAPSLSPPPSPSRIRG